MIQGQAKLLNKIKGQRHQAQQIDGRKIFWKYVTLFFFLIIYGITMAEVKQNYPQILKFNVKPLIVQNITHQQNGHQKNQQQVKPVIESNNSFTDPVQKQSQLNYIEPQSVNPIPQVIKSKVQTQSIKKQKVQTQTYTQKIKDYKASQGNVDASQKQPSKQQSSNQTNFNGISKGKKSSQPQIVPFIEEIRRNTLKRIEESSKNDAEIKELIKQEVIIRKRPTYDNFKTKLQQIVDKRCKLFSLILYPYLREGATSPPKVSKSEMIMYQISRTLFGNFFYSDTHFWEDLFKVFTNGWYWQSSGKKLTVGTYTQLTEYTRKGSQMLFNPTQITLVFPYFIPSNERIAIWGVKTKYDIHQGVQKINMRVFLGNFEILPTQEERRLKQPIWRKYYCAHYQCNQFYSFIQIQSVHYDLAIKYVKIQSGFIVTVQH